MTKPETRFIRDLSLGILKSQQITLNQIGIHLFNSIKLKSTLERFRRQFSKPDLLRRLIPAYLQEVRSLIHSHDYAPVDITDIQKRYSRFFQQNSCGTEGFGAGTGWQQR